MSTLDSRPGSTPPALGSHGNEARGGMGDVATQLRARLVRGEVPLEDTVPRAVAKLPLVPELAREPGPPCLLDDDELARDAQRVIDEASTLRHRHDVAVVMTREHDVERVALERERGDDGEQEPGGGQTLAGEVEHLGALVDGDDVAAQESSQIPRAACDVENTPGREAGDECLEVLEFGELGSLDRAVRGRVVLRGPARVVVEHRRAPRK